MVPQHFLSNFQNLQPRIVLNLFLGIGQISASCSYKIVLIKKSVYCKRDYYQLTSKIPFLLIKAVVPFSVLIFQNPMCDLPYVINALSVFGCHFMLNKTSFDVYWEGETEDDDLCG